MFVSADEECSGMPNSQDPASSAAVAAAATAANAYYDQMFSSANADWLGLMSRSWKNYASFGPNVALQLLNGQPAINAASLATGVIMSDPSTDGSGSGTGTAGGGSTAAAAVTPDDIAFAKYFGSTPRFKTYTGLLPKVGSSMSLVMGGQNRALPVGGGRYPAATPLQAYGNPLSCASPTGVLAAGAASVLGGNSGVVFGVLGLLALAGLGYWAEHSKTKGRR